MLRCAVLCCALETNSPADSPSGQTTDNIDYNSLKHFIKVNTNKDEAKAIAIPGQQDTHLAKVENELYHELCAQHDRAGLFVTAKADEINRRLRTWPLPAAVLVVASPPRRAVSCGQDQRQ